MKRLLLICITSVFLQFCPELFVTPTHAADIGRDCGFDQINLSDEVGKVFNERIESVLQAVTTGKSLFGGLIFLAIISLYLDYLRGQLNWKDFLVRIGITIFLLKNYAGPGNFRDTIINAADKAADSIRFGYPGGNPLEAIFETLYNMFKNMQGTNNDPGSVRVINWLGNLFGIGEIGDAAHVIALFFSPAGITTILFIVTTLTVAILSYVLDVGATLLILVLSLLGPIAICFCSIRSTMSVATGWFQRFIEINLWKIIYACFMVGIATVYEKLGAIAFNPQQYSGATDPLTQMTCAFSAMLLSIVVAVVSIFMLSSIPSIAAGIVEGRGSGMGMTASFLVGAASGAILGGIRSGVGSFRQRMIEQDDSSSSSPPPSDGTDPNDGPSRRSTSPGGSTLGARAHFKNGFREDRTASAADLVEDQIDDSKSESFKDDEERSVSTESEDQWRTADQDQQNPDKENGFSGNAQKQAEKSLKSAEVERLHQGTSGTQVTTTSKRDLIGRTRYTTSTTDNSGKVKKEQTTMDPVQATSNHQDQLKAQTTGGQEFNRQWIAEVNESLSDVAAARYIASSNEGMSVADFPSKDGKQYTQTANNKTGNVMTRTPITDELGGSSKGYNKHLSSASGNARTFHKGDGMGAVALNRSAGSDHSSITVYRSDDGKFSVQERSGSGDLKRSHGAENAREALSVRDDWKNEGNRNNVSYANQDLRSHSVGSTPKRTHQSNDGEVLITTRKGHDDQGKESYLVEKTNTKTGKTDRTIVSSVAEAELKHNSLLADEFKNGRKFTEIKV